MDPSESAPPGLWGSLCRVLNTLLGVLQTRIELFATELQEQQVRWADLLVMALVGALLGTMGLMLITVAVVWAVPAGWRVPVTFLLGFVYMASAVVVFVRLRRQVRGAPPALSASVDQIGKDRAWLKTLE